MLDYILFFLFILYIAFLPTCDSYKCGGVAVWRCGGWGRKRKGRRGFGQSFQPLIHPASKTDWRRVRKAKQRLKLQWTP